MNRDAVKYLAVSVAILLFQDLAIIPRRSRFWTAAILRRSCWGTAQPRAGNGPSSLRAPLRGAGVDCHLRISPGIRSLPVDRESRFFPLFPANRPEISPGENGDPSGPEERRTR